MFSVDVHWARDCVRTGRQLSDVAAVLTAKGSRCSGWSDWAVSVDIAHFRNSDIGIGEV